MQRKYFYWLFPIIWMGIIFYSSSTPYEKQDLKPFFSKYIDFSFLEPLVENLVFYYHNSEVSVEALGINGFIEFFIRKGAHFAVFFILFFFLILAFVKTTKMGEKTYIGFSILISILYAISDEIHQGFTANRTPYVGDVIIDTTGILVGAALYLIVTFRKNKKRIGT